MNIFIKLCVDKEHKSDVYVINRTGIANDAKWSTKSFSLKTATTQHIKNILKQQTVY